MTHDSYRAIRIAGWLLLFPTATLFFVMVVLAVAGSWWATPAFLAFASCLAAGMMVGLAGDREYQVRAGRRRLG